MARLTRRDIERIAQLARLRHSDAEIEGHMDELEKILTAFDSLSKVTVPSELENDSELQGGPLRLDIAENLLSTERFIAQAPAQSDNLIRVPAVIERE